MGSQEDSIGLIVGGHLKATMLQCGPKFVVPKLEKTRAGIFCEEDILSSRVLSMGGLFVLLCLLDRWTGVLQCICLVF